MAGVCAALSAARQGVSVSLVESRFALGGRIGEEIRFPFDLPGSSNSPYGRESGLLDEIFLTSIRENREGTYAGQSRSLSSMIAKEDLIHLHLGTRLIEAKVNSSGDRVQSCLALSLASGNRILFKSDYFIDCSGNGNLAQLAEAPGEKGIDLGSETDASNFTHCKRSVALVRIIRKENPVYFTCPEWVRMKWEDNHLEARLEWLESLDRSLLGHHHLEWISMGNSPIPTAEEIAWCAWDYLKNRSPIREAASNLALERISPVLFEKSNFRGNGDYRLSLKDLMEGSVFHDSVAVGRAPLDGDKSLLTSIRGKLALPHPFEIPLRSLYSSKLRNLLWAGEHLSADHRTAPSVGHPPTASQIGVAVGHVAAHCISKKRLPRTLAKKGHVEELRQSLELENHRTGLSQLVNESDKIQSAKVSASSSWEQKDLLQLKSMQGPEVSSCLIQFAVTSELLEKIRISLACESPCSMEARILKGSSIDMNLPGTCLDACTEQIDSPGIHTVDFSLKVPIAEPGWHYLELVSTRPFRIIECEDPPPGFKTLYPKKTFSPGGSNPYCDFVPRHSSDFLERLGPRMEITPRQILYSPTETTRVSTRPTNLPNLWVSRPTDFKYPEFLEFSWSEPVEISSICLHFDSSPDISIPPHPTASTKERIPSIIREYRVYSVDPSGKSFLLIHIKDNFLPFCRHSFPSINASGIELEILSTNGLDRAQVFRVSAYE